MYGATRFATSVSISPVGNILGDVAAFLGDGMRSLLGMFYPPQLGKKANVVVTELVTNVLENIGDPHGLLRLELDVDGERLRIAVSNTVTPEQYEAVRARVEELCAAPSPKQLLADTIRARRSEQLKGGLGLMRLVVENKFELSAEYRDGLLTVCAVYRLEATA